ncbi:hypothetical protein H0H93_004508 [Arthromyces matolae]|nr:hypothetical protein H0H93_004508 [Arthromyces matolae]
MIPTLRKILVVGGNGFIGSAICKAALAKGIEVTSVSSSGQPYRTQKGHVPVWTSKVDWQKGDALHPESFAHLFPEVDGVVHTLGVLMENSKYKAAVKQGDVLRLLGSLSSSFIGDYGNPLERSTDDSRRDTYDVMNRDTALRVCEAFISSPPKERISNVPRPFIYISAEDIFRPVIPARYIETKREAERGIESLMEGKADYRGVYIRPSEQPTKLPLLIVNNVINPSLGLVYHAHQRPLTTPAAVLFDLSATLHARVPSGLPTPSSILRRIGAGLHRESNLPSSLESFANALSIPPIHVDHVAKAVCVALDSENPVRGVIGVRQMRELIGWAEQTRRAEIMV